MDMNAEEPSAPTRAEKVSAHLTSCTRNSSLLMGDQREEPMDSPTLARAAQAALDTIDCSYNTKEESDERHLSEALQRSLHVEKFGSSGLTTEQKRMADVVTPPIHELSPGMLSSLRGSSSPSYSQVSVGSIGPTVLTGLPRTFDLTPVTRNTSAEYHTAAPVTPGDFLHGEHLALPADLNEDSPSPPLKMSVNKHQPPLIVARGLPPEGNAPPEAVQFPARKFFSFTTREQYEEALLLQGETYDLSDDDDDDDLDKIIVQPYAPRQRRDNFDIESLSEEELQQIFCTGSDESSTTHHRLASIPLGDRIPSLRLANGLRGSITSFTSYNTDGTDNDEEDSLVHIQGDADDCESLNSSTHLRDSYDEDDPIRRKQRKRKQLLKEERAVEWLQSLDSSQVAEAASSKFLLQQQQQPSAPRKQAVDLKRITSTPAGHP